MTRETPTAARRNPFRNPFSPEDSERHGIWHMLVARDSDAFAAGDWSLVEKDFAAELFEGITGDASDNPDHWKITYPTLDAYRDDWLRMAERFKKLPLAQCTHREFIYKLTRMDDVEIAGDRALCHKKFIADEPLTNGERHSVSCQTLYRLQRINGIWKIAGFIGYLPLPMGGAARRDVRTCRD